jgi:hypothetical protein
LTKQWIKGPFMNYGLFSNSRGDADIALVRPFITELWPLDYEYKKVIVSALLLYNYWQKFNKTLWKPLIQS